MTTFLLGIDGGSQSTKVSVIDENGRVHATGRAPLRSYELGPEGREGHLAIAGEDVLDDVDPAVVVEGHVDVPVCDEVHRSPRARRAFDREADPVFARSKRAERRGEDGPRTLFRVAEEAPGPLPCPDLRRRELEEVGRGGLDLRGHEVHEGKVAAGERRPIEVVVRDKALMLVPAVAGERDLVDGRMSRSRQAIDDPEGGERQTDLAPDGAREGVAPGQAVVHLTIIYRQVRRKTSDLVRIST